MLSLSYHPLQLKAFQYGLSSHDCSRNVYVKKNGFTLHRNPIAQSTDGARGKIGFSEGRHAWEIWWEGPLGTVAVIGIATKRAPMQCQGYVALLGSDDQSWGWNLVDNNLLHNGEVNGNFPQCNNAPKYQVYLTATLKGPMCNIYRDRLADKIYLCCILLQKIIENKQHCVFIC